MEGKERMEGEGREGDGKRKGGDRMDEWMKIMLCLFHWICLKGMR